MSSPWWAALPAVETQVQCGTGKHTVRWADGKLIAVDHPDADSELVLAALGGEASECVELLEAWGRHSDDLEVLALGPRSAADEVTVNWDDVELFGRSPLMPGAWASYSSGGWASFGTASYGSATVRRIRKQATAASRGSRIKAGITRPVRGGPFGSYQSFVALGRNVRHGLPGARPSRSATPRHLSGLRSSSTPLRRPGWSWHDPELDTAIARRMELLRLFALGTQFQLRLSGTVAAAWSGGQAGARDQQQPALAAALTGRLAPAVADWLGIDPDRVAASGYAGRGWGRIELSRAGADQRLLAELPVGWLASVWAPGLAVVDRHLVVDVTAAAWPRADVLGLPEPGAAPVVLSVSAQAGHWSVDSTA